MSLRTVSSIEKNTEVKAEGERTDRQLGLRRYFVERKIDKRNLAEFQFQNGRPEEVGINGVTVENLIAICIDRLEGFNETDNEELKNNDALESLRQALTAIQDRNKELEDERKQDKENQTEDQDDTDQDEETDEETGTGKKTGNKQGKKGKK